MSSPYKTSIPTTARERVVKRYEDGCKEKAEYLVGRKVVGVRIFGNSGHLEFEYGLKDGKRHGMEYRWDGWGTPKLLSATPYVDGVQHGTARQWDERGRIVGKYKLVRGTGLDLWWQWRVKDKSPYLAETIFYQDGQIEGFEWWINEDQRSVYIERHWKGGNLHGIHREWFRSKRLDRGYPKFFVHNNQVSKREYIKASKADPSLPPYRAEDDKPTRIFPAQVAKHLCL